MARVAARMSGLMSIGRPGVVVKVYKTGIITKGRCNRIDATIG